MIFSLGHSAKLPLFLISLVLLLSGCGGGSASPPSAIASYGSLQLSNNTGQTIISAYLVPTSSSTWGQNQLSASMQHGGFVSIISIPAGEYKLKVELADSSIQQQNGISISSANPTKVTINADAATTGTVLVNNSTGKTISYLYIKSVSSASWGSNRLSGYPISTGGNFTLPGLSPGAYDIWATLSDGSKQYKYGVSIAVGNTTTAILDTSGSLQLSNNTGQNISEVYVAPPTATTWGTNQLGVSPISSGTSLTLNNIPSGGYSLKVVLADGSAQYRFGVTISLGNTTTATFAFGSLQINNISGQAINSLYYSIDAPRLWGAEQLGGTPILAAGNFTIPNVPSGTYSIKAILADGSTEYQWIINIAAGTTSVNIGMPTNGTLQFINNTGQSITELSTSASNSGIWGANRLGSVPITNGGTLSYLAFSPGSYDARVKLADGTYRYQNGFTVSAGFTQSVTFVP